MFKAKPTPFGNLPHGSRFAFANGNVGTKEKAGWYIDATDKRRRLNAFVNVYAFRTKGVRRAR